MNGVKRGFVVQLPRAYFQALSQLVEFSVHPRFPLA